MKIQRTFQGLEAEFRSTGAGRFGGIGFLTLWLAFWIVGEVFALWILGWGAWSLITGQPPGAGRAPLEIGPSLAMGLFLLFWTAFWTFGGVMAGGELLRLLFGRDRLVARTDSLEVIHGYGLFNIRKTLPHSELVRFYVPQASRAGLSVETLGGPVILARFGTSAQWEEAAGVLNNEFKLSDVPRADGILPITWRELTAPEGYAIFVKDPVTRRRMAMALWIIFAPLAATAAVLIQQTFEHSSLGALAAIVGTLAFFAGWGAWRVSTRREEWVPSHGEISLDLRRPGRTERLFTADTLEIREDRDSDGDPTFKLMALQGEAWSQASLQTANKFERVIAANSGDPVEVLGFGRRLAHRCAIPLSDRTTPAAQAEDLAALQEKLAASGRLGRWAARWIVKVALRR